MRTIGEYKSEDESILVQMDEGKFLVTYQKLGRLEIFDVNQNEAYKALQEIEDMELDRCPKPVFDDDEFVEDYSHL